MEDSTKRRYALTFTNGVWSVSFEDGNRTTFDRDQYQVVTVRESPALIELGPDRLRLAWQNETAQSATSRADLIAKLRALQA